MGFTSAAGRQHLKAFLRRSVRSRLCPPQLTDLTELVEAADNKLFQLILKDNRIPSSICLIAILLFVHFLKTVIINYSPSISTTHHFII